MNAEKGGQEGTAVEEFKLKEGEGRKKIDAEFDPAGKFLAEEKVK